MFSLMSFSGFTSKKNSKWLEKYEKNEKTKNSKIHPHIKNHSKTLFAMLNTDFRQKIKNSFFIFHIFINFKIFHFSNFPVFHYFC